VDVLRAYAHFICSNGRGPLRFKIGINSAVFVLQMHSLGGSILRGVKDLLRKGAKVARHLRPMTMSCRADCFLDQSNHRHPNFSYCPQYPYAHYCLFPFQILTCARVAEREATGGGRQAEHQASCKERHSV
jgi:hypothetical protein